MTQPPRPARPRDPEDGSLETRLALVQQMIDRAAAELHLVMTQLKGDNPGGTR